MWIDFYVFITIIIIVIVFNSVHMYLSPSHQQHALKVVCIKKMYSLE